MVKSHNRGRSLSPSKTATKSHTRQVLPMQKGCWRHVFIDEMSMLINVGKALPPLCDKLSDLENPVL